MNGHKMGWVEERIGEMSVLGTGAYWGEERTGERSVLGRGAYWGEERTAFLVERPEEKRPLGMPRLRDVDNIKTDNIKTDI